MKVLLVLTWPFLLGAKAGGWVQLAEHDLTFAKYLTNAQARFGPEFMNQVISDRVIGCRPRQSKLNHVDEAQLRQIEAYCEHYCLPWYETWSKILEPCDTDAIVPEWCKAENAALAAEHLKFDPYFETLTAALSTTNSPLERYNVMAVIADRLGHKVLRDYRQTDKIAWATSAALVFLKHATAEEAMVIGWSLLGTRLGESSTLGQAFRSYAARTPQATNEQRRLLDEIGRGLAGEVRRTEVLDELRARIGVPSPPPPAPVPPDRIDSAALASLVERVDAYYRLLRDERYAESWGMLSIDRREGSTQEEYIRTEKYLRRHGDLLSWRVQKIQISGDMAKVLLEARYKERAGLFQRREGIRKDPSFWVFENGSWYRMIPGPTFWENRNPIEVPLPKNLGESNIGGSS